MEYKEFVDVYEALAHTTKKLEKTKILANFLKILASKGEEKWIYLFRGRVLPDYDAREFGISTQLVIKAISTSFGILLEEVANEFNQKGDLGELSLRLAIRKKQSSLFSTKLSVKKVFENLVKLMSIEGSGAVDKKIALIAEIMHQASPLEAKYIVRTLMNDLRIGVADALLLDALRESYFPGEENMKEKLEEAYDLANDFALIFGAVKKGKLGLEEINLVPGRPVKAMLAVKVESIEEGFKACGKPLAVEHKYDGFRMFIHKTGEEYFLYTRKLENVTLQFPDVVDAVKKFVKGDSFILDSEVVGFDPNKKNYLPFEAISQRIKRKYEIAKLIKELPVEINVFDVLFYQGENLLQKPFVERRAIVEKIIRAQEFKIKPSFLLITDKETEAEKFYKEALKIGEEGIMMKVLNAPYKQGRKVGYMVKMKPIMNDLDLVIVGAEYGTGKRGGWLTSYIVACRDGERFLEIGKVSSGLKEKEEEGTTYDEMTSILKPLIRDEKGNEVRVEPKVVVSVTYQNIQESPSYSSGFALRFPRITHYRPDKQLDEIATLLEIKNEAKKNVRIHH